MNFYEFEECHKSYDANGTHRETEEGLQHKDRANLIVLNDNSNKFESVIKYIKENL